MSICEKYKPRRFECDEEIDRTVMLTQKKLKQRLLYNPLTGIFVWKSAAAKNIVVGSIAGYTDPDGYVYIGIDSELYSAHRLAWLYMTGTLPMNLIDHKNRSPSDNRFVNLREATRRENACNSKRRSDNTSGHKGVSWSKLHGKWRAQITRNGTNTHIGLFVSIEDAIHAYQTEAKKLHGEFFSGESTPC